MFKLKPVFQSYFNDNVESCIGYLSSNPSDGAIDLLETHKQYIDWRSLSSNVNPRSIKMLRDNQENIDWEALSANPSNHAIDLLLENVDKINWYSLSRNPNDRIVYLLKSNQKNIYWFNISINTNNNAVKLIEEIQTTDGVPRVYYDRLSSNPTDEAVRLLIQSSYKINKPSFVYNTNDKAVDYMIKKFKKDKSFCCNSNDKMIDFIEANPDIITPSLFVHNTNPRVLKWLNDYIHINPKTLSYNPICVPLFEKHPQYINEKLFRHQEVFEVNLETYAKSKALLHEELLSVVLHPDNYDYFKCLDL